VIIPRLGLNFKGRGGLKKSTVNIDGGGETTSNARGDPIPAKME